MRPYRDFLPSLRLWPTLALSPDGTRVAYVDDASGQYNLTVRPLDGGEPRALTSYPDSIVRRMAWHPREPVLVFEVDTKGDEYTRICRVRLDGGEPQLLAAAPQVKYMMAERESFSPDGKLLAYTGTDRAPEDEDVLVRDMATGDVRRLYTGGGQVLAGSFSPDGTRLSLTELRVSGSDHVIHLAFPDGSPPRRLTPEGAPPAAYWLGPWLPDGSGLLVRANVEREHTGLAIMSVEDGELTWLDTPDSDVEGVALSADGRVLVWSVNLDGATQLRARDMTTGRYVPVPPLPPGVAANLSLTPDGASLVMRFHRATEPTNVVVFDLRTGELRNLTGSRPASADPATFVEPEITSYPSGDHRVPALLYRPRDVAGRVPVVLSIHGGPAVQERPLYNDLYQCLLSSGVAVFAPNIRGSAGYGTTYKEAVYRDWGGVDLEDLAAAAAHLHSRDWVDPTRIGLLGGSYGGFAVLSCVSRLPEVGWAAAVDWCGPSNLLTFARSQPPSWHNMVAKVVGDPEKDADFLMSRSPVTYADQIRAPLFVIQGANDPRVPQAESDQIVAGLRERGVEVRYDVYPDAGHGFGRREDQIRAYSDIAEFLVDRLSTDGT